MVNGINLPQGGEKKLSEASETETYNLPHQEGT
jgi:hypothetical protein